MTYTEVHVEVEGNKVFYVLFNLTTCTLLYLY